MRVEAPFPSTREQNRVAVALGTFYIAFTLWVILRGGLFTVVGVDFRACFASARIAATMGFSQVYDLAVQKEVQDALMTPYAPLGAETIPTPFLPVFVLPFIAFLPLGLGGGFSLWTLLNIAFLVIYLDRFTRGIGGWSFPALALLSFPVFQTLFLGQVNAWLLFCAGEFLRAWEQNRPFRSGMWLGGLLLKPQTLLFLLPVLLLKRKWKSLAGFAVVGSGVAVSSLGLAGWKGMSAWWALLTRYPGGLSATNPEVMGNFRMLGWLLSLGVPSWLAWGIAFALGGFVALMALIATFRPERREEEEFPFLALLAATCAVAWHSHTHMAAVLVPPLLRQVATGRISGSLWLFWVVLPPVAYLLGIASIPLLTALEVPLPPIPGFTWPALAMLGLQVYFVAREVRWPKRDASR